MYKIPSTYYVNKMLKSKNITEYFSYQTRFVEQMENRYRFMLEKYFQTLIGSLRI